MPTLELVCERCGHKFTKSADHFIPGVSGFINGVTFIDPTKSCKCPVCVEEIINEALQFVMKDVTPEEKLLDCLASDSI